jgi:hypothetical protein
LSNEEKIGNIHWTLVRNMAGTSINIVDALRGQQEQLKRLIAQKIWISDASKETLSEMAAQITELQRLLAQLEQDIEGQLKED